MIETFFYCCRFCCGIERVIPATGGVVAGSLANLEAWSNAGAVIEDTYMHHGWYGLRWKSNHGKLRNNYIGELTGAGGV